MSVHTKLLYLPEQRRKQRQARWGAPPITSSWKWVRSPLPFFPVHSHRDPLPFSWLRLPQDWNPGKPLTCSPQPPGQRIHPLRPKKQAVNSPPIISPPGKHVSNGGRTTGVASGNFYPFIPFLRFLMLFLNLVITLENLLLTPSLFLMPNSESRKPMHGTA